MKTDISKILSRLPVGAKDHKWRVSGGGFIFVDGGPMNGELIGDFPGNDAISEYVVYVHNSTLEQSI